MNVVNCYCSAKIEESSIGRYLKTGGESRALNVANKIYSLCKILE